MSSACKRSHGERWPKKIGLPRWRGWVFAWRGVRASGLYGWFGNQIWIRPPPSSKRASVSKSKDKGQLRPAANFDCDLHEMMERRPSEGRCATVAAINRSGYKIWVASVQLDVWDESGRTREAEARGLLRCLQHSMKPGDRAIVMGDFNAVMRSDIAMITGVGSNAMTLPAMPSRIFAPSRSFGRPDSRDAAELAGVPLPLTVWPGKRVDFILLGPGFSRQNGQCHLCRSKLIFRSSPLVS